MPCDTNENTSECYCELPNFKCANVGDGNLRHCYCKTSSGEMCAWFPQDCYELYNRGIRQCGVYTIQTTDPSQLRFSVYCNMTIDVFQRRRDGSVDFNQNWTTYEGGFGNLMGDFWLGNEKLCHITQQLKYKLRIDRFHYNYRALYSVYDNFVVLCANESYKLVGLNLLTGTLGTGEDGLINYSGKTFKTCDQHAGCECGWWCCYLGCRTNLNGQYNDGIKWAGYAKYSYIEMKMKPFST
ncbi:Tenascin-R [Holothuria leucospilota]|uniref:Tenascin-R n=1 Tax=Holothuria leucospilota TaxID=206669 RepID=A0A9Q1BVY7_HOLLE|nr:Tenascin-R [Holothuria leucospilota]